MKKLFFFVTLCFLAGCASIDIPSYIQDENPYDRVFEVPYDGTLDAVEKALIKTGWVLTKSVDPVLYERSRELDDPDNKQILLFTDVRQLGFVVGTRYARLNIYLLSKTESQTEVEVRYLTANSVGFKTFYNYRHDNSIDRFFGYVEKFLTEDPVQKEPTQNF